MFTPSMVSKVIELVKAGVPISDIGKMPGLPKKDTIRSWTKKHPSFKKQYKIARNGKVTGAPKLELDQTITNEILTRIAKGETLIDICKDRHIPGLDTIYGWRRAHPKFADEYTQARMAMADTYADKMNTLAAKCRNELSDLTDARLSNAWKETYRMELDALKWTSSKLKPQLYGDKAMVDINSQVKVVAPDAVKKHKQAGTGKKKKAKKKP